MPRIAAIVFVVTALLSSPPVASAATITFNTSDSQFDAGIDNQGWYATNTSSADNNDNYIVGLLLGSTTFRDFFTFDLATLNLTGQVLTSATLELTQYTYQSPDLSETIGFFDVTTSAATLNQNGVNPAAFADLGTGTTYGTFVVPSYAPSSVLTLTFQLNGAALTNILAAAGGFFSIGGSLLTIDPLGPQDTESLFFSSGGAGIQRLILETEPASTVVPEPASLLLLGTGMAGFVARARRRRRNATLNEQTIATIGDWGAKR